MKRVFGWNFKFVEGSLDFSIRLLSSASPNFRYAFVPVVKALVEIIFVDFGESVDDLSAFFTFLPSKLFY